MAANEEGTFILAAANSLLSNSVSAAGLQAKQDRSVDLNGIGSLQRAAPLEKRMGLASNRITPISISIDVRETILCEIQAFKTSGLGLENGEAGRMDRLFLP